MAIVTASALRRTDIRMERQEARRERTHADGLT